MLFALINTDRPGNQDLRAATRPAHLAYMSEHASAVVSAGALLDSDGQPCGSLLVIDAADREAALAFAAADPYAKAGLFEGVVVRPFRPVFKDGEQVG